MAIYRILKNSTFGPQEISAMTAAYELTLTELGIDGRADRRTETIASAIVHRASNGESEVRALADYAVMQLNAKATEAARPMPVTPDFSHAYAQKSD
jgi:hypothetical protein